MGLGWFATVSDVLGEDSHVFTYNDDLQLETETIDGSGNGDVASFRMTSPVAVWQYDLDGNLTQDGRYKYVWDGDNRLIEAATRKDLGANTLAYDSGDLKLTFQYDYLGRRVRKVAWTYNGSGWDEDSDLLFVYDGWNVVMVLDANDGNAILRKYTGQAGVRALFVDRP